jgi:hypothetical protein
MIRYLLNLLLGLGYLLGLVLVWLGLELLIFDRDQNVQGVMVAAAGIAWWSLLAFLGKRLAHRHRRSM